MDMDWIETQDVVQLRLEEYELLTHLNHGAQKKTVFGPKVQKKRGSEEQIMKYI